MGCIPFLGGAFFSILHVQYIGAMIKFDFTNWSILYRQYVYNFLYEIFFLLIIKVVTVVLIIGQLLRPAFEFPSFNIPLEFLGIIIHRFIVYHKWPTRGNHRKFPFPRATLLT